MKLQLGKNVFVLLSTTILNKETMTITKEDVWGQFDAGHNLVSRGMIVAQGFGGARQDYESWKKKMQVSNVCPVWRDKVPFKSVTVICKKEQEVGVTYWLEYVHGGGSISNRKDLPENLVALRSDYKCW